jgi:ribonuclease I
MKNQKISPEKKQLIARLKKVTNEAVTKAFEKTNCQQTRNAIFVECWQLFESTRQEIIEAKDLKNIKSLM